MNIGVCGAGEEASDADVERSYQVGRLLAEVGHTVVTGGLGGVMASASRGARDGGGLAVGLLPGADPGAGNEHLDVVVPTGLGEARNALLVRAVAGIVVVGGSWGTLSELALAVRTGRPVVTVGGWTVTGADGTAPAGLPPAAGTPEEAVERLGALLRSGPTGVRLRRDVPT